MFEHQIDFCNLTVEESLGTFHNKCTFVIMMAFLMGDLDKPDNGLNYLGKKIEYCQRIKKKKCRTVF